MAFGNNLLNIVAKYDLHHTDLLENLVGLFVFLISNCADPYCRRMVHNVSAQSAGSSRLYWRIIYAMAESGAIYAVLLCTYFIVTATNVDHAEVIISYIGPPVIGITPALVFLRLFSRPESMTRTTNHQSDSLASAAPSETVDVESNSIPMTVFASRR
ncbi:hypothetical protein FRC02_006539 [Tulasnella sp. 418]|nr:hypothetical protein FRC02_006539 [Tulasnella sp. 418]